MYKKDKKHAQFKNLRDTFKDWLQRQYRTPHRKWVYVKEAYFPLRTVAMLLTVLSNKDSEQDFAHRSSFVSVSDDDNRWCNIIFCSLPRTQHEHNASLPTTNNSHLIFTNSKCSQQIEL